MNSFACGRRRILKEFFALRASVPPNIESFGVSRLHSGVTGRTKFCLRGGRAVLKLGFTFDHPPRLPWNRHQKKAAGNAIEKVESQVVLQKPCYEKHKRKRDHVRRLLNDTRNTFKVMNIHLASLKGLLGGSGQGLNPGRAITNSMQPFPIVQGGPDELSV